MAPPFHTTLTAHLISLDREAAERATCHPFLRQAGLGLLPAPMLASWLVQDIHYTRGYVRFMGGLLSSLQLPITTHSSAGLPHIYQRFFDLLIGALNNIQREMRFFDDTVEQYRLRLEKDQEMEETTKGYVELFNSVGNERGLLEGAVVLFATEWCYLNAWTYARSYLQQPRPTSSAPEETASNAALDEAFIPNWTNEEFQAFVRECGDVLNELAEHEGIMLGDNEQGEQGKLLLKKCEEIFRRVVWLEERFWPNVGSKGEQCATPLDEQR